MPHKSNDNLKIHITCSFFFISTFLTLAIVGGVKINNSRDELEKSIKYLDATDKAFTGAKNYNQQQENAANASAKSKSELAVSAYQSTLTHARDVACALQNFQVFNDSIIALQQNASNISGTPFDAATLGWGVRFKPDTTNSSIATEKQSYTTNRHQTHWDWDSEEYVTETVTDVHYFTVTRETTQYYKNVIALNNFRLPVINCGRYLNALAFDKPYQISRKMTADYGSKETGEIYQYYDEIWSSEINASYQNSPFSISSNLMISADTAPSEVASQLFLFLMNFLNTTLRNLQSVNISYYEQINKELNATLPVLAFNAAKDWYVPPSDPKNLTEFSNKLALAFTQKRLAEDNADKAQKIWLPLGIVSGPLMVLNILVLAFRYCPKDQCPEDQDDDHISTHPENPPRPNSSSFLPVASGKSSHQLSHNGGMRNTLPIQP